MPDETSLSPEERAERIRRYQANLDMEREGIELYEELGKVEKNPARAKQFREMGEIEVHHARVWEKKLVEIGAEVPEPRRHLRPRAIGVLARLFGTKQIAPMVLSLEGNAARDYQAQGDAPAQMIADEQSHAQVFRELARSQEPGDVARHERWHRGSGNGSLRAGIFGINDGLVSNFSLVMGFAGATATGAAGPEYVLLAGVAGLIAGASSMAAGEWVSVQSQRELFERQIALEKEEIALAPEAEAVELALLYEAKGLDKDQAREVANTIMQDKEVALRTMALEELGMDPDELGSAWGAAISSFLMFTIGAFIPVLPFLLGAWLDPMTSIILAGVLSGLALFTVGATMGIITGRNFLFSGVRMLLIGAAAAALTFGIGSAIGVTVG